MTPHIGTQKVAALGLVLLVFAGCATQYAYDFRVTDPTVEDEDIGAQIVVDVPAAAVLLEITNKTDEVLQVDWAATTLTRADGSVTSLRPDVDLGWVQPHATVSTKLVAFALPRSGVKAAAYEGSRFQLDVPAIVHREQKIFHYTLSAHVRELKD